MWSTLVFSILQWFITHGLANAGFKGPAYGSFLWNKIKCLAQSNESGIFTSTRTLRREPCSVYVGSWPLRIALKAWAILRGRHPLEIDLYSGRHYFSLYTDPWNKLTSFCFCVLKVKLPACTSSGLRCWDIFCWEILAFSAFVRDSLCLLIFFPIV